MSESPPAALSPLFEPTRVATSARAEAAAIAAERAPAAPAARRVTVAMETGAPARKPSGLTAPRLDAALQEVLALELANDIPLSKIARTHGFTSAEAVKRAAARPDVAALVIEKRKLVEMSNELVLSKLAHVAPDVADNIAEVALDPTHPKFLQAAMWLIDKRLPNIQRIEQDVHVRMDADISAQVLVSLDALRQVREGAPPIDIEADPHLRDGVDVMADRDHAPSAADRPVNSQERVVTFGRPGRPDRDE